MADINSEEEESKSILTGWSMIRNPIPHIYRCGIRISLSRIGTLRGEKGFLWLWGRLLFLETSETSWNTLCLVCRNSPLLFSIWIYAHGLRLIRYFQWTGIAIQWVWVWGISSWGLHSQSLPNCLHSLNHSLFNVSTRSYLGEWLLLTLGIGWDSGDSVIINLDIINACNSWM